MGPSIDDSLKKEGIFEESQAQAVKEVVAWRIAFVNRKAISAVVQTIPSAAIAAQSLWKSVRRGSQLVIPFRTRWVNNILVESCLGNLTHQQALADARSLRQ